MKPTKPTDTTEQALTPQAQTEQLIPDGSDLVPVADFEALQAEVNAYKLAATTVRCHVYPTPENANPKAPLYRVEVEMPAPLAGVVIECPVFAERDARTGRVTDFSVSMPGGKFQSIKPLPMFVEGKDGKRYPISRSEDATGKQSLMSWQNAAKKAVRQHAMTGETFQIVTL